MRSEQRLATFEARVPFAPSTDLGFNGSGTTVLSRRGRVETVREMVRSLETLTGAGQRHTMGKVVDFIAAEIRGREARSDGRARLLARTVDRIASEPARLAPAVRPFSRRAEVLLALLQAETA